MWDSVSSLYLVCGWTSKFFDASQLMVFGIVGKRMQFFKLHRSGKFLDAFCKTDDYFCTHLEIVAGLCRV